MGRARSGLTGKGIPTHRTGISLSDIHGSLAHTNMDQMVSIELTSALTDENDRFTNVWILSWNLQHIEGTLDFKAQTLTAVTSLTGTVNGHIQAPFKVTGALRDIGSPSAIIPRS